jgi:hypothetical protein
MRPPQTGVFGGFRQMRPPQTGVFGEVQQMRPPHNGVLGGVQKTPVRSRWDRSGPGCLTCANLPDKIHDTPTDIIKMNDHTGPEGKKALLKKKSATSVTISQSPRTRKPLVY